MDYERALAVFAAADRLLDHDPAGALVKTRSGEQYITRAQVVTAAHGIERQGYYTSQEALAVDGNGAAPVAETQTPTANEANGSEYCARCEDTCTCEEPLLVARWSDVGDGREEAASNAGSTANGNSGHNQFLQEVDVNRHTCTVTKKNTWAGQDGSCVQCRTEAIVAGQELTAQDVEMMSAPMFVDLLEEVGGEPEMQRSLLQIQAAKLGGRAGTLTGRKTREILNLIMQQPESVVGGLVTEYREYLLQYGVTLTENDGVFRHNYAGLVNSEVVQLPLPGVVLPWQAQATEYYNRLNAAREAKRVTLNLVMSWEENGERKQKVLGTNNAETRKLAGEYQAAARAKSVETGVNYRVKFDMVPVSA